MSAQISLSFELISLLNWLLCHEKTMLNNVIKHALERGVQFVTPILKDEEEDLIQVFSGEWYFPGSKPSGMFFEFLQRDPSSEEVATVQKANKQTWFRDETFLGLYGEKEREYQSGKVMPFISDELFNAILEKIGHKQVWSITEKDLALS